MGGLVVSGGGGGGDPLTRGAHGQSGGRQLHVKGVCSLQCFKLLKLLMQSSVLFRQCLAAPFQILTVYFRLLQLRPVVVF